MTSAQINMRLRLSGKRRDFSGIREALPEYLKGFATFGYTTGWRSSEIANLTWRQVDLDQGIVRLEVGETKNNEGRTVDLDEELKEIFARQREFRKQAGALTPYVFTNPDGTDTVKDFRKSWLTAHKYNIVSPDDLKLAVMKQEELPSGTVGHNFGHNRAF